MRYAEVCVNSPIAGRRTFSYSIPPGLNVETGQAVFVPFGSKTLQGVVLELTGNPAVEETKDIEGVIDPRPVLSPAYIALARWISEHYLSPLFDAVALMLPPGFERKALTFISPRVPLDDSDASSLSEDHVRFLEYIRKQSRTGQKELEKVFGQKKARNLISRLAGRGLVERTYELEPIKARPKLESYLRLAVGRERVEAEIAALGKKAAKQAALLALIAEKDNPVSMPEIRNETAYSKAAADALVKKGLISVEQIEVRRDPLAARAVNLSFPLNLTADQSGAFESIVRGLKEEPAGKPKVFLLYGVTGSGKTEVYLQALAEEVKSGRRGIVLVPEIALTPQTIERFSSRFPGRVAVLHSQLSLGERYDEWQRIRNGEVDVVIGPRSAVFAPQPDLGLIILDEEHEWTYKQSDTSPRYHARDAAVKLTELTGATIVLGSATPDVETYYHAKRGDYVLLGLPERVTPYQNSPLPPVEVVDLREELKSGNRSMFSRSLSKSINKAVSNGQQVMLFLNRRGGATFIQCRDCGYVVLCRRCRVPLSYHPVEDILLCHQCNYRTAVPRICPQCGSQRIKFIGTGTQKLEQEAASTFTSARLLRWDSDTTREKGNHQAILDKFRSHEADILIGTQMITKGLDLPGVTLVGVVNADTALHLPDFRAGERTFQLLSQVAGRAGRGLLGGKVIFQTYSPENYAIRAAARHDYTGFYEKEIEYRRQLNNPPFSRLASLTYVHQNDAACQREAEKMQKVIREEIDSRGMSSIGIIGPAPAFIPRLRGRYRWQLILRGSGLSDFLSSLPVPQGWIIDIDPVGL
jgi:primosomal protein N' (replication factor Y) (superfamily II helicase)